MAADHPTVEVKTRSELRVWLEANHDSQGSIWLITWKKHTAHHVPYDAIVEEALCFGWIDSQPRLLDEDRSMVRLSPRKLGSAWSAVNKRRVSALIEAGVMQPAGLAVIELAKASGAWSKVDDAHSGAVPDDLALAFRQHPGSQEQFEAFPPSARKAILEWIELAKRPDTRKRRVDETARLAALGERANKWRK